MDGLVDSLEIVLGVVISSCENGYNFKRPKEVFSSLIDKRKIEGHPIEVVRETYDWLERLFDNSTEFNPNEVKDYAASLSSSLVVATL